MDFQFTLIYNILATFALLKYSGYLDPASASVIIAMIIGAFVGAGMTLRVYWLKVKQKLFHRE
jgi:uncharacterized membrane protein YfcA|tara:strand:+ start:2624 stop:2812 length:189 start_codon:yes stop_codon:yes gene_type:complete